MIRSKHVLALLIAVGLCCAQLGCSSRSGEDGSNPSSGSAASSGSSTSFPVPDPSDPLSEAIRANPDVVGWLQVPGTTVDEAVVKGQDNEYYLRRDAKKNYNYAGCLFLDYRSNLKPISQNLVIYGHNLGVPWGRRDEPDSVKFAQLLKFADLEFAKKNPYLYFSTPDKDYTYEIFAVYYSEAYTTPVEYHHSTYSDSEFKMLIDDSKARSLHRYPVDVRPGDKLLTLSTCSYKYGTYSQNPNQRFVVVGRLVRAGETYHETASATKNESPKQPSFVR